MSRVSTYLNFTNTTEEAFLFYRGVFGTEFDGEITRMGDAPTPDGQPALSEADANLVMHVALPTLGGHMLMGTDAPESMGFTVTFGNSHYINLEPDTREEADTLFTALADGGTIETPMQEMFWGAYYGSLKDRFGVQWMVNCTD